MKIQKNGGSRWGRGFGLGGRVDVNEELKFCEYSKKWGVRSGGWGVVGNGVGVRLYVNKELKFL